MMKKWLKVEIILLMLLLVEGCAVQKKVNEPLPQPSQQQEVPEDKPRLEATTTQKVSEKLAKQSQIKKFVSYDELKQYLETNVPTGYSRGYGRQVFDMKESAAVPTGAMAKGLSSAAPTGDMGGGGGSDDFSKTNIQVEGVDEADIVKTDGEYIYAVAQNNLYIVKAYPADKSEVVSMIKFDSMPQNLYLSGDRLVIYGYDQQIYAQPFAQSFRRHSDYTFFKIFDIKDKKNPKQVKDLRFEGALTDSRLIGDYVYLFTTTYNYSWDDEMPVPRILDKGTALKVDCTDAKCYYPDIYYFDMPYETHNFVAVNAINIKDENAKIDGEVYLMSQNQNLFVSQQNIYITYTKYVSEYEIQMEVMREIVFPRLGAKEQEKIAKIEATENFILSQDEKKQKIGNIIERYGLTLSEEGRKKLEEELTTKMKAKIREIYPEMEKTVIHKIAVDKGQLEYQAAGEVPGYTLNQFSMDESDGYFRIATTRNQTWSNYLDEKDKESYSNLFILDKDMKAVGKVENLAKGERIYSVRFLGKRAYMVTFKQTDPLFVIDVSTPTAPKVLGELKVPGFSQYLHPYDENTIIGFGQDTAENSWGGTVTNGLKLSLFDVSDLKKPKEVDKEIVGGRGSYSAALSDHKAFLFSKEKNLIAVPATLYENKGTGGWDYGRQSFNGLLVFSVDKAGVKLRGRIDHAKETAAPGASGTSPSEPGMPVPMMKERMMPVRYDNPIKRALYIDDTLYSVSDYFLKANQLSDLKEIKELELKKDKKDDYQVIN